MNRPSHSQDKKAAPASGSSRRAKLIALLAIAIIGTAWGQQNAPAKKTYGLMIFDINPDRLEPRLYTVQEGSYYVRIRNGLSTTAWSIQLDHETLGTVLKDAMKEGSSGIQKAIDLVPGKHTLTVGGKAKWTATIVVVPATK